MKRIGHWLYEPFMCKDQACFTIMFLYSFSEEFFPFTEFTFICTPATKKTGFQFSKGYVVMSYRPRKCYYELKEKIANDREAYRVQRTFYVYQYRTSCNTWDRQVYFIFRGLCASMRLRANFNVSPTWPTALTHVWKWHWGKFPDAQGKPLLFPKDDHCSI